MRIDSIAQSRSVLSGCRPISASAVDGRRRRDPIRRGRLALLFHPRSTTPDLDPAGHGYVPGVRENGGQYTGDLVGARLAARRNKAGSVLDPRRSTTPATAGMYCYKVEPYVRWRYAEPPHTGRGGWTWYGRCRADAQPGSSGSWASEARLISSRASHDLGRLRDRFRAHTATYEIVVETRTRRRGIATAELDGNC
jgi:hypothetical protein